jgi:16S rRNA (uracil1498-N3)-methyltransferase
LARRRFFVERVEDGRAELTGDDAHHLARVLRAQAGQQFEIADGRSAYLAEVMEAGKSVVRFRVLDELPAAPDLPPLTLFAALIKFDRFEWLVEKATELGAARIVPVETARSEAGLLAAAPKRAERWRKIARESAQQSRRVGPLAIGEALKLAAVEFSGWRGRLEERPGCSGLWDALEAAAPADLGILLGPEGGWTDGERERLDAAGWQAVTLGSTILRSETAGIAAAAVAAQWWDRRLHCRLH